MKNFINELKKEYSMIVTPSFAEVGYISFLVLIICLLMSLAIVGIDSVIIAIINNILFK